MIRRIQTRQLNNLLSFERLGRMIDAEAFNSDSYSALSMMIDLRKGLWSESTRGISVDVYRRNLQRSYIERLTYLMKEELERSRYNRPGFEGSLFYDVNTSDIRALVRGELKTLKRRLNTAKNASVDKETKYHYEDVIARIDQLFDVD